MLKSSLKLSTLKIQIPETLLIDDHVVMFKNSSQGGIECNTSPGPNDFLDEVEQKYPHDINKSFFRPTAVVKR